MRILERLTLLSPGDLIPYAEALTCSMALLLEPAVPRRILQTVNKLWISLNTVMPRRYVTCFGYFEMLLLATVWGCTITMFSG